MLDGCQLNREAVGAGRHEVAVVGEGRVSIHDAAGAQVLALDGGESGSLETTAQTYTVRCSSGEEDSSTELESTDG